MTFLDWDAYEELLVSGIHQAVRFLKGVGLGLGLKIVYYCWTQELLRLKVQFVADVLVELEFGCQVLELEEGPRTEGRMLHSLPWLLSCYLWQRRVGTRHHSQPLYIQTFSYGVAHARNTFQRLGSPISASHRAPSVTKLDVCLQKESNY